MKRYFLFLFSTICSLTCFTQNIDSLWKAYNNTVLVDTLRLNAINYIGNSYKLSNPDTAIAICKQTLALAKQTGQIKYEGRALTIIGTAFMYKGNYPEALKSCFAALNIHEKIKDKSGVVNSYYCLGNIYYSEGIYPEALKMQTAALKISAELKDKKGIAKCYNNIGNIYSGLDKYPEAIKSYTAALKLYTEIKYKKDLVNLYFNIGFVCKQQNNQTEAIENFTKALIVAKEINSKGGMGASYVNIGTSCTAKKDYKEATKNYLDALKIFEETQNKVGIANAYYGLGVVQTALHKTKEAEIYLNKALALSITLGVKNLIEELYFSQAVLDSTMGNYKAAFAHHKLFIIYRDSLNNEESHKKSIQSSMQYEFDKKELAAKAEQDKLDVIHAEEKQKQRLVIYAVTGLLILIIVFAVFMFNRFKITQRQKAIIEQQKQRVDEAYNMLHEKNKEVMDSIRYAKRIQTALITSEKYMQSVFTRLMKNN